MTNTDTATLLVVASYDEGSVDTFNMSIDELSDWVHYNYAYDEYDSILVDGVEASDLV
jgi:hypothetical protein